VTRLPALRTTSLPHELSSGCRIVRGGAPITPVTSQLSPGGVALFVESMTMQGPEEVTDLASHPMLTAVLTGHYATAGPRQTKHHPPDGYRADDQDLTRLERHLGRHLPTS
jgi:hypothetical protein